jgi:hypothetical protein
MVDGLAVQGIRRRHPAASDEMIGHMRVELRLGRELAMVVALLGRHAAPFANAIERDYYVDVDTVRAAVKTGASFNAVHLTSAIKVDFFVAGDDPCESERLRSRERIETPGGVLYVDTAEHTMLRKLEWYRRGGEVSERQWRDVRPSCAFRATAWIATTCGTGQRDSASRTFSSASCRQPHADVRQRPHGARGRVTSSRRPQ